MGQEQQEKDLRILLSTLFCCTGWRTKMQRTSVVAVDFRLVVDLLHSLFYSVLCSKSFRN